MVSARSIVVQEALCAFTVELKSRWQAEGVFRDRQLTVYGLNSEDAAIAAWKELADSVATSPACSAE